MKGTWVSFIAGRLFFTRRKDPGIRPGKLALAGLAVGVAALVSVMSVMNGLQLGFIETILEVYSHHIQIHTEEVLDPDLREEIRGIDGIESVLLYKETQTLIQSSFSDWAGVSVRGLEPEPATLDPVLAARLNLRTGSFDPGPDEIVLGRNLAFQLGVSLGDRVSVLGYSVPGGSLMRPSLVEKTVSGIYESGYYEYDAQLVFTGIDAMALLDSRARPVYGIKLDDRFDDQRILDRIETLLSGAPSVEADSWRYYNRSFFGALRMEKVALYLTVGLIFLVVSINIYHSLKRSIAQRQEEIGVLRSIGASPGAIRLIFSLEGFFLGGLGASVGLVLGLALALNVNRILDFGFLWLGTGIQPDRVPVRVLPAEAAGTALFAVLSSTLAAWLAVLRASRIPPARVLREE